MNYNIYQNITDEQYFHIEKELAVIEKNIFEKLKGDKWYLSKSVVNNDSLVVDFVKKENDFYGNIGIVYEDEPNSVTFMFYVTKSFDENNYRYFLRDTIDEFKTIESMKNSFLISVETAKFKFDTWTKDHIKAQGLKIKLP